MQVHRSIRVKLEVLVLELVVVEQALEVVELVELVVEHAVEVVELVVV